MSKCETCNNKGYYIGIVPPGREVKLRCHCEAASKPPRKRPAKDKLFTVHYTILNGCGDSYWDASAQVMARTPEEAMAKLDNHFKKLARDNPHDWQARSARPARMATETEVIK